VTAFLLDTNVVSEIVRPAPDPSVLKFLARENDLWLSVITLHELNFGAARIADVGRRHRLTEWIESLKARFRGRLIVIDQVIAELAGRARAHAMAQGRTVDPLDALIAASARSRSMTLATRNMRDFVALDVVAFNPWNS
jgi:toxin FitB